MDANGAAVLLESAQDHKRAFDNDRGPNTGGMGSYSPAAGVYTAEIAELARREVLERTIEGMRKRGSPYEGILFGGLMVAPPVAPGGGEGGEGEVVGEGPGGPAGGAPAAKLLEWNVRFGDPECQSVLMRMKSDLLPLLWLSAEGRLDEADAPTWTNEVAVTVVLAARGYPADYARGGVIALPDPSTLPANVKIFHAGTATRNDDGALVAAGGRVLGVTALGATATTAREAAYRVVDAIEWEDKQFRRDIAWRAVEREGGGA